MAELDSRGCDTLSMSGSSSGGSGPVGAAPSLVEDGGDEAMVSG